MITLKDLLNDPRYQALAPEKKRIALQRLYNDIVVPDPRYKSLTEAQKVKSLNRFYADGGLPDAVIPAAAQPADDNKYQRLTDTSRTIDVATYKPPAATLIVDKVEQRARQDRAINEAEQTFAKLDDVKRKLSNLQAAGITPDKPAYQQATQERVALEERVQYGNQTDPYLRDAYKEAERVRELAALEESMQDTFRRQTMATDKATREMLKTRSYHEIMLKDLYETGMTSWQRAGVEAGKDISEWGMVPRWIIAGGASLIKAGTSALEAVASPIGIIAPRFVGRAFENTQTAYSAFMQGITEGTENTSPISDVGATVFASSGYTTLAMLTGGAGALPFGVLSASIATENIRDSIKEYGSAQAVPNAVYWTNAAKSLVEGGVEYLSDAFQIKTIKGIIGKGAKSAAKSEISKSLLRRIADRGFKTFAQDLGKAAISEGLEEGVQGMSNYIFDVLTGQRKPATAPQLLAEIGQAMLYGALGGLTFGIIGGGIQRSYNSYSFRQLKKAAREGDTTAKTLLETRDLMVAGKVKEAGERLTTLSKELVTNDKPMNEYVTLELSRQMDALAMVGEKKNPVIEAIKEVVAERKAEAESKSQGVQSEAERILSEQEQVEPEQAAEEQAVDEAPAAPVPSTFEQTGKDQQEYSLSQAADELKEQKQKEIERAQKITQEEMDLADTEEEMRLIQNQGIEAIKAIEESPKPLTYEEAIAKQYAETMGEDEAVVQPEKPKPTVPVQPNPEVKPETPAKPVEPAKPDTPKPVEPAKPDTPKPVEPAKPEPTPQPEQDFFGAINVETEENMRRDNVKEWFKPTHTSTEYDKPVMVVNRRGSRFYNIYFEDGTYIWYKKDRTDLADLLTPLKKKDTKPAPQPDEDKKPEGDKKRGIVSPVEEKYGFTGKEAIAKGLIIPEKVFTRSGAMRIVGYTASNGSTVHDTMLAALDAYYANKAAKEAARAKRNEAKDYESWTLEQLMEELRERKIIPKDFNDGKEEYISYLKESDAKTTPDTEPRVYETKGYVLTAKMKPETKAEKVKATLDELKQAKADGYTRVKIGTGTYAFIDDLDKSIAAHEKTYAEYQQMAVEAAKKKAEYEKTKAEPEPEPEKPAAPVETATTTTYSEADYGKPHKPKSIKRMPRTKAKRYVRDKDGNVTNGAIIVIGLRDPALESKDVQDRTDLSFAQILDKASKEKQVPIEQSAMTLPDTLGGSPAIGLKEIESDIVHQFNASFYNYVTANTDYDNMVVTLNDKGAALIFTKNGAPVAMIAGYIADKPMTFPQIIKNRNEEIQRARAALANYESMSADEYNKYKLTNAEDVALINAHDLVDNGALTERGKLILHGAQKGEKQGVVEKFLAKFLPKKPSIPSFAYARKQGKYITAVNIDGTSVSVYLESDLPDGYYESAGGLLIPANLTKDEADMVPLLPDPESTIKKMRKIGNIDGILPSIMEAIMFASTDTNRAILNAVNITYKDGIVTVVSTDGRRIYNRTFKANYGAESFSVTIATDALEMIKRLNPKNVEMYTRQGEKNVPDAIMLKINGGYVQTAIVDHMYPEWEKAYITGSDLTYNKIEYDAKAAIAAINDLLDGVDRSDTMGVTFVYEDSKITFSKGDKSISIPAKLSYQAVHHKGNIDLLMPLRTKTGSGVSNSGHLNGKYLSQLLATAKGGKAIMYALPWDRQYQDPFLFDNVQDKDNLEPATAWGIYEAEEAKKRAEAKQAEIPSTTPQGAPIRDNRKIVRAFLSVIPRRLMKKLVKTDTGYLVYMKNGKVLKINIQDGAIYEGDKAVAGRIDFKPAGDIATMIDIARNYNNENDTAFHEGFHFAFRMFLTDDEQSALITEYGNEEAAAIAFAKYAIEKKKGGIKQAIADVFKKLWLRIQNFISRAENNGGIDSAALLMERVRLAEYAPKLSKEAVALADEMVRDKDIITTTDVADMPFPEQPIMSRDYPIEKYSEAAHDFHNKMVKWKDAVIKWAAGMPDVIPFRTSYGYEVVSRDTTNQNKPWRVTYFSDEYYPQGHYLYDTKGEAVIDAATPLGHYYDPTVRFKQLPLSSEIAEAEAQMEAVRKQYQGTDQWMKAPNGKPTNLNERQWLQVRTPNFLKWFGDWINDPKNASKVVDENGEPMVVYHGSNSDMDTYDWQFKKEYLGKNTKAESAKKAFFFAKDRNTAMSPHYSGINYDVVSSDIKAIGEEIREAVRVAQRLDVWNADEIAKDIDNGDPFIDVGAYRSVLDPRDIPNNIVEALENLRNGIEENSDGEEDVDDAIETLTNLINMYSDTYATEELMSDWLLVHELFLDIRNPNTYDYRGSRERAVTYADLLDEASDEGMDGAIFYNTYDGGDLDNIYAVFSPEQIKSATANVGTFDPENPDIRFKQIVDAVNDTTLENIDEREADKKQPATLVRDQAVMNRNLDMYIKRINAIDPKDKDSLKLILKEIQAYLKAVLPKVLTIDKRTIMAIANNALNKTTRARAIKFMQAVQTVLDTNAKKKGIAEIKKLVKDNIQKAPNRDVQRKIKISWGYNELLQYIQSVMKMTKDEVTAELTRLQKEQEENDKIDDDVVTVEERERIALGEKIIDDKAGILMMYSGMNKKSAQEVAVALANVYNIIKEGRTIMDSINAEEQARHDKTNRMFGLYIGLVNRLSSSGVPIPKKLLGTSEAQKRMRMARSMAYRVAHNIGKGMRGLHYAQAFMETLFADLDRRGIDTEQYLNDLLESYEMYLETEPGENIPENLEEEEYARALSDEIDLRKAIEGDMEVLREMLDFMKVYPGDYNGWFSQTFFKPITQANRLAYIAEKAKHTMIDAMRAEIYRTVTGNKKAKFHKWAEFMRKLHTTTIDISVVDRDSGGRVNTPFKIGVLMTVYAHMQREEMIKTLDNTGFDERARKQVADFMENGGTLGKYAKEWVMWVTNQLFPVLYDDYNASYMLRFGVPMSKVEVYTPIIRDIEFTPTEKEVGSTIYTYTPLQIMSRNMIERLKSNRKLDIDKSNFDTLLLDYVHGMEHFKYYSPLFMDAKKTILRRDNKLLMKKVMGKQFLDSLVQYYSAVAMDKRTMYTKSEFWEKAYSRFMFSVMMGKIILGVKQVGSFPLFLTAVKGANPVRFVEGMVWSLTHPLKVGKLIADSPMLQKRYSQGFDIETFRVLHKAYSSYDLAKLNAWLMKWASPTKHGDMLATAFGGGALYHANYKYYRKQGMNHDQAHHQAVIDLENATIRTQQSSEIYAVSHIQAGQYGGLFGRLLTSFQSAPIAYYNLIYNWVQNAKIGKKPPLEKLFQALAMFMFTSILYSFLESGFETPDSPDDVLYSVAHYNIGNCVVVGQIAQEIAEMMRTKKAPYNTSFMAFEEFFTAIYGTAKYTLNLLDDYDDKDLDKLAQEVGTLTGIPYRATKAQFIGLIDTFSGENTDLAVAMGMSKRARKRFKRDIYKKRD